VFALVQAFLGLALVLLALVVAILAFVAPAPAGVRVWSVVGLVAMVSAALGGYQFLQSGFANNPSSAQMVGSFIGALASEFLALYRTK
jgi:hypothetical protein